MKLISTKGKAPRVDFPQALFQGLAPDGGLYVPESEADLKQVIRALGPKDSFQDVASAMLSGLLGDMLGDTDEFAASTFPFGPEIRDLGNNIYVLELWHGPSGAFKDYGASFLAASMERLLSDRNQRAIILTATSGDTGGAVAQAFHNRENIDVVILYPEGRVSPLQEKQLTTLGGNIHAFRVKGAFDDCQRMVKEAFMDADLCSKVPLTSANSINIGRLIPQSFYYVYAHAQLKDLNTGERMFVVPSGNFGNLTAGVLAWRWGMPVDSFLASTNANDVVPDYLKSGIYTPRESVSTYSNAMDVGSPSNFDRLMHIFGHSVDSIRTMISGEMVSDTDTLALMKRYYLEKGIFLDPHTAVGVAAAERRLKDFTGGRIMVLGTAHPGKFLEVVEQATGVLPPLPERLEAVLSKEGSSLPIGPDASELKTELLRLFA